MMLHRQETTIQKWIFSRQSDRAAIQQICEYSSAQNLLRWEIASFQVLLAGDVDGVLLFYYWKLREREC
ncbi:hypothetical protein CIPAW_14G086300 [Carya illinoinensis]|uniref:Uncharacterized protein n=1 Tax=Carya illinoinensis TaxID=32201 RepID=A0A8T1NCN0_CARIL|nr:hypothetical protein CIPAW_14G086300 [Carya illinoinensis]